MSRKPLLQFLKTSLMYCVLSALALSVAMFAFVFIINWEDWFFGIRIEGFAAGLSLLSKAVAAVLLGALIIGYPVHLRRITIPVILYFGYLFVDSSLTIQKTSGGQKFFSPFYRQKKYC